MPGALLSWSFGTIVFHPIASNVRENQLSGLPRKAVNLICPTLQIVGVGGSRCFDPAIRFFGFGMKPTSLRPSPHREPTVERFNRTAFLLLAI